MATADRGFANNVTRLLAGRGIVHRVHRYDYDAGVHSAVEVAGAIGLPPERVFKTLVVDVGERTPALVVVPGPETLDLKVLAAALGKKKVAMATRAAAEAATGLQAGGISPLALLGRGFRVWVDDRIRGFETVAVSAGTRGVNVELPVSALLELTRARVVNLG